MTPRTHLVLRLVAVAALVTAAVWPSASGAQRHGRAAPAAGTAAPAAISAMATLAVR